MDTNNAAEIFFTGFLKHTAKSFSRESADYLTYVEKILSGKITYWHYGVEFEEVKDLNLPSKIIRNLEYILIAKLLAGHNLKTHQVFSLCTKLNELAKQSDSTESAKEYIKYVMEKIESASPKGILAALETDECKNSYNKNIGFSNNIKSVNFDGRNVEFVFSWSRKEYTYEVFKSTVSNCK